MASRDVANISGFGPAIRSRSIVYDDSNTAITLSTTLQSPDGLTSRQETLGVANPSTSTRASYADRADGAWTDSSTAPDGTKQVTEYSNWLAIAQEQHSNLESSSLLSSVSYGYDALRRQITQTHSRTGLVTTIYAASGQVASIDDHSRITSFAYDNMGRTTSITLPDSSITHTSYWLTGQVKSTWGSQSNPTVNLYDSQGRQTALRTFRSDNLALAPDESTGSYDETTWTYNDLGQMTAKTDADSKSASYTYTAAGRLLTRTWARGVITTYGYDTAGNLVSTDYGDTTPDIAVTYDKLGRQTSISNGVAKSEFAYDATTFRLDTETISYDLDGTPGYEFSRVLDRSNDAIGRDTGWQLKTGSTVENQAAYGYSSTDGRLETVTGPGSSTFTYGYVPGSNLIASVTGPVHTVTNTWFSDRDALHLKENKVGSTVVSSFDYSVNAIGQRGGVAQGGSAFASSRTVAWGYDALGQVTSGDSSETGHDRTYEYDAIGNRLKSADSLTLPGSDNYTTNGLNQYTAVGAITPTYDDDGNATAYPVPAYPSANSALAWDGENRLISATVNGVTTSYVYDSQSRRIAVVTASMVSQSIYDGWNVIAEYDAGTLTRTQLWGIDLSGSLQGAGGVGGLLSGTSGTGTHYATYDGNGNVSEYLDSSGIIAGHFEYDAFGRTVVDTDTGGLFGVRFSTKKQDVSTGLYYYGYRYYDPETGRWPSRDPIGEQGGVNLYCFVGNDGVGRWDYLGLVKVDDELPDLAKIAPEWATPEANPFQGVFRNDAAQTITVPVLACACEDGKIRCVVIVASRIFLNPKVQPLVHGGDKPETWKKVYGHEQLHVKAVIQAAEKIVAALEAEPNDPANPTRAAQLTTDYKKDLNEAIAKAMEHDEEGDKSDTRPKPGQGYDSKPGTPPIPPKP